MLAGTDTNRSRTFNNTDIKVNTDEATSSFSRLLYRVGRSQGSIKTRADRTASSMSVSAVLDIILAVNLMSA